MTYTTVVEITAEHKCANEDDAVEYANENRDVEAETETETDGRLEPHVDDPSDNEKLEFNKGDQ